jgi:hypothetical protein
MSAGAAQQQAEDYPPQGREFRKGKVERTRTVDEAKLLQCVTTLAHLTRSMMKNIA